MGDDAAVPAGDEGDAGDAEATTTPPVDQAGAPDPEVPAAPDEAAPDEAESDDAESDVEEAAAAPTEKTAASPRRLALICGLVAVLVLAGLTGWLGYHAHLTERAKDQRALFLQVGKQGAVNLTTIDFEHVDDDVKRILDSATGQFYDEFQQRAQPFVEVVKQVKSKSVGTVTEAGLQIPDGDAAATVPTQAEVLVAVTVNTSIVDQPEQAPRAWRMRIQVQQDTDGQAKVSNVEFVP